MNKKLEIIPIDKIIVPKWDIRRDTNGDNGDSDNNDFSALVQSIKKDGIISPITVSKTNRSDKYEIVAGRRRFKACKMLGLREIPAVIESDTITEDDKGEKQRIALIENLHRKDLTDIEKAEGILSIYTNTGYQPQNIIRFIKFLDNNGYQPGTTIDRNRILSLGKHYLNKTDTNNSKNEPTISEKFLDIVDSIGYSPNTQYKYLQIVVKLEPDTLKKAEAKGLNINKKIMLINKELNKNPIIQKSLIDKIAYKPEKEARIIVNQTVRDLETGAIKKIDGNYIMDYDAREKVDAKVKVVKQPIQIYMDINAKMNELMELLTGHKLDEDEESSYYTEDHVQYSEKYRIDVLKSLDEGQVSLLTHKFLIAMSAMSSMVDIIQGEDLIKQGK